MSIYLFGSTSRPFGGIRPGITALASRLGRTAPRVCVGLIAFGVLLLQGCASLPEKVSKVPSTAIAASPNEELGRIASESVPATARSGFRPLPQSVFSMDARLTLARHAQKSLDLQYYLLENDVTGHTVLRAVRDAALRGVRVRILVDDLYTASSDRMLVDLSAYPNVEVRLFNPFPAGRAFSATRWAFALSDIARVNHRMHNKMFIADGAFAVAGGRNLADEYFFNNKEGNFVDFDLLVAGDAVPRMAAIFDTYWNSPRVYPLLALESSRDSPEALRQRFEELTADAKTAYPTPPAQTPDLLGSFPLSADIEHPPLKMLYGAIDVFADNPEKVTGRAEKGDDPTTVTSRVIQAMQGAQKEVTVGSPYFIPGKAGLEGLKSICDRDVQVYLLTNSLASNDEPFASAAYGRYRVAMLKMGVHIYEIDPDQMAKDPLIGAALRASIGRSHSKLVIIDHHTTFVGSMNMDLRSSRENTELGLLVESPVLADQVLHLAEFVRSVGSYTLQLKEPGDHVEWVANENGAQTIYQSEPGVSLGTQLQILFFFPFISESLL